MPRSEWMFESGEGNLRNSEGSFVTLNDGRILFAYTRYGASREDHAGSEIACCYSDDQGVTWSKPETMFVNETGGGNVMSVSFLRLASGRILLSYLTEKFMDGESYSSLIPVSRYSDDEGKSWSSINLMSCFSVRTGMNNDRMIQLKSGRIIAPVWRTLYVNTPKGNDFIPRIASIVYSDDDGESWYGFPTGVFPVPGSCTGMQEPGVIELADGRLIMWMRTDLLCQYHCYSDDQGATWSPPLPWKYFPCTVTPLSIKRDPLDGKLIGIWSDGDPRWGVKIVPEDSWDRTPFAMAISRDEGKTWGEKVLLEDDPRRGFCYTAIHFTGNAVLLAYCCGGHGHWPLQDLKIVRLPRCKDGFELK